MTTKKRDNIANTEDVAYPKRSKPTPQPKVAPTFEKPKKGQVQVRHCATLEPSCDMTQWPNGQDLLQALSKERVKPKQQGDADFWQAAVRWSLLKKYGVCPDEVKDPYIDDNNQQGPIRRTLQFYEKDIQAISKAWRDQCELAKETDNDESSNDLTQFLKTAMSNGRPLQWTFLDCGPACQFKLHAHPNLEVIYCVSGQLHEIRMEGTPITTTFERDSTTTNDNHLKGPDLSSVGRPWKFDTLREGDFLVNEVGSIHRSFCATNGDGCLLFVLWGGSHADVAPEEEPNSVSVGEAMESMDKRLCDCGSKWDTISEVFLPDSEKSK